MRKPERFVVATDPHGDMADPNSVSALWDFVHDWKPTIRIHAGDNFDFRNLRKGASDDEKAAALLGYRSKKSIYRLVTAGALTPLPVPKCPLHFWRGDVVALQHRVAPIVDRWR